LNYIIALSSFGELMTTRRNSSGGKLVGASGRRAVGGWKQQAIQFPNTWGGKRKGAGRKRLGARANVPHRARPAHATRHPVLVTLRAGFRPLRSQHVFPTVCLALAAATRGSASFRILHFSVQWDHLHLVVEASDERALSRGLQGLAIRVARSVNALVMRRGRFWADRWHGRELTSPRQVRNALVYVLANFRKHAKRRDAAGVDAFSSAVRFDGWRGFGAGEALPRAGPALHGAMARWMVVSQSQTWLGRVGWRRSGLVRVDEAPADLPR
jgi:REP element-mobilizing transposase RayT